jgi:toxin ParE1/3/4
MSYKVQLTEQAKQDLRGIYEYIALTLLVPETARDLTRRIMKELRSLEEMPNRYPVYQEEPWKSRGLRRINIENFSGFYFVTENTVQVIRIMYSRRDISNVLSETD